MVMTLGVYIEDIKHALNISRATKNKVALERQFLASLRPLENLKNHYTNAVSEDPGMVSCRADPLCFFIRGRLPVVLPDVTGARCRELEGLQRRFEVEH